MWVTWYVGLILILDARGLRLPERALNRQDANGLNRLNNSNIGTGGDGVSEKRERILSVQDKTNVNARWQREKGQWVKKYEDDGKKMVNDIKTLDNIRPSEIAKLENILSRFEKGVKNTKDLDKAMKDVKFRVDKSGNRLTPNVQQWQTRLLKGTTAITSNFVTLVDQIKKEDTWGALSTGATVLSTILAEIPHPVSIFAATLLNIASFVFSLSAKKTKKDPYQKIYDKIDQAVEKITASNRKIEIARLTAPLVETQEVSDRLFRRYGEQFNAVEFNHWAITNNLPRMDSFVQAFAEIENFVKFHRSELSQHNTHIILFTMYAAMSMLRDGILSAMATELPIDEQDIHENGTMVDTFDSLRQEYYIALSRGRKRSYLFLGQLQWFQAADLPFVRWYYDLPKIGESFDGIVGYEDVGFLKAYIRMLNYCDDGDEITTMPNSFLPDELLDMLEFQIYCGSENKVPLIIDSEMTYNDYYTTENAWCSNGPRAKGVGCKANRYNTVIGKRLRCPRSEITSNIATFKFMKGSGNEHKIVLVSSNFGSHYTGKAVIYHIMKDHYKNNVMTGNWAQPYYEYFPYVPRYTTVNSYTHSWTRDGVGSRKESFRVVPIYSKDETDQPDVLKVILADGSGRVAAKASDSDHLKFEGIGVREPRILSLRITNLPAVKKALGETYPSVNNIKELESGPSIHGLINALLVPDPTGLDEDEPIK